MEGKQLAELEESDIIYIEGIKVQFSADISEPVIYLKTFAFEGYSPLERMPFRLEFRVPNKGTTYPQGTYRFDHPEAGSFLLFMVPSSRTEEYLEYQVIFS